MQPITIGTKASASVQVTEAQLAVTVGSGSLRVFATPMLAALMEKTACAAVAEFLEDGAVVVAQLIGGKGKRRSHTGGHDRHCNRRNYSGIRSRNHICHYCIR